MKKLIKSIMDKLRRLLSRLKIEKAVYWMRAVIHTVADIFIIISIIITLVQPS